MVTDRILYFIERADESFQSILGIKSKIKPSIVDVGCNKLQSLLPYLPWSGSVEVGVKPRVYLSLEATGRFGRLEGAEIVIRINDALDDDFIGSALAHIIVGPSQQ
jgi:hypothetical protein